MSSLYYEAHVTLEPVLDEKRHAELTELAHQNGFRVAKLLMEKGPNTKDSFCTTRTNNQLEIERRVTNFVFALRTANFTVTRYKIEDTVIDSRIGDALLLL
jgi:hypothetical protein